VARFSHLNRAMAALRESQEIIQKPPTVVAPIALGFTDCFALFLSLVLMLISAALPGRMSSE
jgi:hypothetical protein